MNKINFAFCPSVKSRTTKDYTFEQIMQVARSEKVRQTCKQIVEARDAGNEDIVPDLKKSLPCWVPNRSFGDGNAIKKNTGVPSGVVVLDFDAPENFTFAEQKQWANDLAATLKVLVLTNDFVKNHLLLAHFSPRMKGVHAYIGWVDGCKTIEECQDRFVDETGFPAYDPSCKDNSRKSFLVSDDMFFFVSEGMYDTTAFATIQKEQEDFSPPTPQGGGRPESKGKGSRKAKPTTTTCLNTSPSGEDGRGAVTYPTEYNGIPYEKIIHALVKKICRKTQLDAFGNPSQGNRHLTWLKIASQLRTICDNNPDWLYQLAPQWAFDSPGNDVMQTCTSACEEKMPYGIPKNLQNVIDELSKDYEEVYQDENDRRNKINMSWQQSFRARYKMPELPPIVKEIVKGSPKNYEDAMLLHLLSMFGAMCFSRVRSEYLDGEMHAPNIQVVIEGPWGQGKGKFESAYVKLFERTIERDKMKLELEAEWDEKAERTGANKDLAEKIHQIVQTAGIGITKSKLVDVLCDNQKVHLYMFESEIKAVTSALKTGYGLTYEHIRKAFENGMVYQNTKSRQSKTGIFPVFFNYTFTGTPVDTEKFIGKELEGGTASRIAWAVIPGAGREPERLYMPKDEELEKVRDKIDIWQTKYCYDTVEGEDVSAEDFEVNLEYVNRQLHDWLLTQWDLGEIENNQARKDARLRMGCIAFHCAIVCAALWGFPTEKEKALRQKVCDVARYIATLCIERFLHKFRESQNEQNKLNRKMEQSKESGFILDYLKQTFTRQEFIEQMGKMGKSTKTSNITTTMSRLKKAGLIEETKKKNVYKRIN